MTTPDRATLIRAMCERMHGEGLIDSLTASALSVDEARRVVWELMVLKDEAIDIAPAMPSLDRLTWLPPAVFATVRELVAIAVGESRLPPSRPQ